MTDHPPPATRTPSRSSTTPWPRSPTAAALCIGDDTALIHLLASLTDQAQRRPPHAIYTAHDNAASCDDIAVPLATSPHETRLRFDPKLTHVAHGRREVPLAPRRRVNHPPTTEYRRHVRPRPTPQRSRH